MEMKDLVFKLSGQKVFTADQLAKLATLPLYSQDSKKGETLAVVKFFCGSYAWYITELDASTGEAFGVTVNQYGAELGYISVPELANLVAHTRISGGGLSGSFPFGVERDITFPPTPLKEIKDEAIRELCRKLWSE